MILKAYIHIGPPARSLLTPRKEEGRAFAAALTEEWNANRSPKMTDPGQIVLDKDSAHYKALRRLFLAKAKGVDSDAVQWSEEPTAVYSPVDLERSEILTLHFDSEAVGLGGNAYAEVYALEGCPSCGFVRITKQVRDPVVDLRKARKDIAVTENLFETIVSARLKLLLETERVTGVEFRPVSHAHPSHTVKRRYFQLVVHNVLSPVLAPKYTYANRCDVCGHEFNATSYRPETPDPWTKINYFAEGPWNELHFLRSAYRGWDLMRTEAVYGGGLRPSDAQPRFSELIVSQRLFRILRRHKVTGFWVDPAHLDTVAH